MKVRTTYDAISHQKTQQNINSVTLTDTRDTHKQILILNDSITFSSLRSATHPPNTTELRMM